MADTSIKEATAAALGVAPALIPERLRNRLNGYLRNKTIPKTMIAAPPSTSESTRYTPKPIQSGSKTYLRNVVILDTLFDDPKLVKKLMLNELKSDEVNQYISDFQQLNHAKLDLLQSMQPMQEAIFSFLQKRNIDWNKDELPFPYADGHYASPLIAANLDQQDNLTIYDETLKYFLGKQYKKAVDIINKHPDQFTCKEASLLKTILLEKQAEYSEYAQYLESFS